MNKDQADLTAAGGLPAAEITKYPASVTFVLPDTGEIIVMRKPLVKDSLNLTADKTVDADNETEQLMCMISQICTFDGKPRNWRDLENMPLVDYNSIVAEYVKLTKQGKRAEEKAA